MPENSESLGQHQQDTNTQASSATAPLGLEGMAEAERLFGRQLTLYDHHKLAETPISIIGAGGLGSCFALMARKSGFLDFIVYDKDTLELHNVSNQMFLSDSLLKQKGEALRELIHGYMPNDLVRASVVVIPRFVVLNTELTTPVVVSCVDSMEARRDIWEAFKSSPKAMVLLDARMGAWNNEAHIADKAQPDTLEWYAATLPESTNPVEELPCTGRALFNTGAACAAQACAMLINYLFSKNENRVVSIHHDLLNFLYYQKKTVHFDAVD